MAKKYVHLLDADGSPALEDASLFEAYFEFRADREREQYDLPDEELPARTELELVRDELAEHGAAFVYELLGSDVTERVDFHAIETETPLFEDAEVEAAVEELEAAARRLRAESEETDGDWLTAFECRPIALCEFVLGRDDCGVEIGE